MLQHIARVLRLTQLFALLLVIGMGALLYSVLAQVERAGSWVDHTHKVVDEIAAVRLDSLRAGLWLRNFVISPRKESLERSRASAAHATQAVRHLMDLTGDNPAQHQTMQLLQSELAGKRGSRTLLAQAAEVRYRRRGAAAGTAPASPGRPQSPPSQCAG
jgi:CHASE3 domain sensor protein